MRQVYQVVDGDDVYLQVPLTCTGKVTSTRTYDIRGRIRSEPHPKTGDLHYVAEFYVIQDHWTKITPVTVAQVLSKGSTKDGTFKLLSVNAKIVTVSVADTAVDDPIHPPND